jgi:hypothetical protein
MYGCLFSAISTENIPGKLSLSSSTLSLPVESKHKLSIRSESDNMSFTQAAAAAAAATTTTTATTVTKFDENSINKTETQIVRSYESGMCYDDPTACNVDE